MVGSQHSLLLPIPQGAFEKCSSLGPSQAKTIRSLGRGAWIAGYCKSFQG